MVFMALKFKPLQKERSGNIVWLTPLEHNRGKLILIIAQPINVIDYESVVWYTCGLMYIITSFDQTAMLNAVPYHRVLKMCLYVSCGIL